MSIGHYSNEFEKLRSGLEASAWFTPYRAQAIENFSKRGFPNAKDEEWLHLRLSDLSQHHYLIPQKKQTTVPDLSAYYLGNDETVSRLILVNGQIHSINGVDESKLEIHSFDEAIKLKSDILKEKLTAQSDDPFFSLNTALTQGGLFIQVNKGAMPGKLLQVIHYTSDESVVSNLRHFIMLQEGSSLQLVETFVGNNQKYWVNQVSEIYLQAKSHLQHAVIQQEGLGATHTSTVLIHQDEACQYESFIADFGAQVVRHQIRGTLNKQRSSVSIKGFSWLNGDRQSDHSIRLDHVSGFCESQTIFKSVLDDASRGIFRGVVVVHPNAHKTVAQQSSKNILLSKEAEADPKPQLEIYHDDVKCAHGSTVGQLDEAALFYLKSRGLNELQAKHLLTRAFLSELVEDQPIKVVRDYLSKTLDALMPDTVMEAIL